MSPIMTCPNCGASFAGRACLNCLEMAARAQEKTVLDPPLLQEGRIFHGLEILGEIGKGGMGAVYRARQPSLGRTVAVKILPPSLSRVPEFCARFEREAKTLAALSHSHVVHLYDFGVEDSLYFLVMEFVDGVTLRRKMDAQGCPPEFVRGIISQVCEALAYAHERGVVHRDIKPENVLLDDRSCVKVADFGIAKIVGQPVSSFVTRSGVVLGTPHYMPPEQLERPEATDHRGDIYSLGVLAYELLTGRLPVGQLKPPSSFVSVPSAVDPVVARALQPDPSDRYQTVAAFREEFVAALSDTVRTTAVERSLAPPPRRRLLPLAALLCAAAAAIVGGVWILKRDGNPPLPERTREPAKRESDTPSFRNPLIRKLAAVSSRRIGGKNPSSRVEGFPRNPFHAVTSIDRARLVQPLRFLSVDFRYQALREGYATRWPSCELYLLDTEEPDRWLKILRSEPPAGLWERRSRSLWSHREGSVLVAALSLDRGGRRAFVEIVSAVQERLGLAQAEPRLPFEAVRFRDTDLPLGWRRSADDGTFTPLRSPLSNPSLICGSGRTVPGLRPADLAQVHGEAFERSAGRPEMFFTLLRFKEERLAAAMEQRALLDSPWPTMKQAAVLRFRALLAVLVSPLEDPDHFRAFLRLLESWMGVEAYRG